MLVLYDFPKSFSRFQRLCADCVALRGAKLAARWETRRKRGLLDAGDAKPGAPAVALRVLSILTPGDAAAAPPLVAYLGAERAEVSEKLQELANVAAQLNV